MQKDIFERFAEKWGDAFDYSQAAYNGYKSKMHIFCKKHQNWFWQTPEMHLKFNGCKLCSKELKSSLRSKGTEEFIEECKKIYGNHFTYNDTVYVNGRTDVIITCPKHGNFTTNPTRFLNGSMCPMCNKEKPSHRLLPFDEVLKKFRAVHGDKYKYDEATYKNSNTKMRMICPIHGEFFKTPNKHLHGQGCPKCGEERKGKARLVSHDEFVKRANFIHNNSYDYSDGIFKGTQHKIKIICHKKDENGQEHGEFWQMANSHLHGCGCPKCAQEKRTKNQTKTFEAFIAEAKKAHKNDNYEYDEKTYRDRNTEMRIICPTHGEFWQKPSKHLRGHGCPKCAKNGIHLSQEEYIQRVNEVHRFKYLYDDIGFVRSKDKIKITCPTHGVFYQEAESHLCGHGCPKCAIMVSNAENEIFEFLRKYFCHDEIIERDRKVLNNKEIDILIPKIKLGIEYNGLYWHCEKFGKNKYFHLDKTEEAKKNGIDLIQIFEDEWANRKDVVKAKIKHIIGEDYDLPKIMARKCEIKEITSHESSLFLEENHIQGKAYSTVHLGAYYRNELIAVMLFKKDGVLDKHWELNRFASNNKYLCQGIGGKLFNYFIKNYDPLYVKSFADRRWTTNENNNLYTKLGFKLEKTLEPDYRYILNGRLERIHKFNFRKQILHKKYGFDLSMSENEMTKELKAYKIWDCGLYKYAWIKENDL